MTIDAIYKNVELARYTFKDVIVSTNYKQFGKSEISWNGYNTGIFRNLYAKEYEQIIRNKQYTFLLKNDLGCIQLYYKFSPNSLDKIKLCYYPYPIGLRDISESLESYFEDSDDPIISEYYFDLFNLFSHQFELSLTDEKIQKLILEAKDLGNFENEESIVLGRFDSKYSYTNSSHIRVDYDHNVESHNKCEIQVGAINNIRLPIQKIVMPFTFCDFIIKNIASNYYKNICTSNSYKSQFQFTKNRSIKIEPFTESNFFIDHN